MDSLDVLKMTIKKAGVVQGPGPYDTRWCPRVGDKVTYLGDRIDGVVASVEWHQVNGVVVNLK